MHDILFENANDLSVPALKRYAAKIALNEDQFSASLESGRYSGDIDKEITGGSQAGVNGTPAFSSAQAAQAKITGTLVSGAQPLARFRQVIDDLLKVAEAEKSKRKKVEERK